MRQHSINIDSIGHPQPIPLACRIGPILATSGIMGRDGATRVMPDDVAGQVANCFTNLTLVLAEAGMDLGDVVKITFYVRDSGARDAINAVWLQHFPDPAHRPARHTQIATLRGAVLIQLDALAVAKETT
ncbi:MAG TPA: RidA family protein [Sphingomonadaceae bacterium]|jgi:2-iminobutanoate/2-iminopropanoate deaminase|nr:RidA family protein [Sphingomonadaceae bacterium]